MFNKSHIFYIFATLFYIIVAGIMNALDLFSATMVFLISTLYWIIVIIIYVVVPNKSKAFVQKDGKPRINLSQEYIEVTPLYPFYLMFKFHMFFGKNVKVYAKVYMGCAVKIKVISRKAARAIVTDNWEWFYSSFKEKEPN